MRLTLFWRVILAQSALIALVLLVGLYALSKLDWLTRLDNSILTTDSTCIEEEKRLLKIFLGEMRNAEKYLISHDKAFQDTFLQGTSDFGNALASITALIETEREKELAREIADLHARYVREVDLAASKKGSGERVRVEVGDGIIDRTNELIQIRERTVAGKTAAARDHSAEAAGMIGWMTLGGIVGALLFAFFHARGVSAPLRQLAREMRHVGRGDVARTLDFRSSKEVHDLALAFNRMAEELAELDKLKADFTAHVSHELRTPLTAIREGTALLLEEIPGPLAASQREILEVVRNHSERLFRSISSLLDLSKMEAEMMEYELTPCDPAALIRKSIESVQLIARGRRIALAFDSPRPLPLLHVDERRMGQVIDNLLSNALKFTAEGGQVQVTASVQGDGEGEKGWVEVRISDTGQGIPEEDLEKIFERFYQSGRNTGKNRQGTGLGLAIARHILKAHNGGIRAESKVGEGSTFIFTLPVTESQK
jgi:two-component system sensor histidine kinase GlrK